MLHETFFENLTTSLCTGHTKELENTGRYILLVRFNVFKLYKI